MSSKFSAVGVVYSEASDTGFGGYFVQCGQELVWLFIIIKIYHRGLSLHSSKLGPSVPRTLRSDLH